MFPSGRHSNPFPCRSENGRESEAIFPRRSWPALGRRLRPGHLFQPNSGNAIHLLIPFYEYQSTRHTAHAPQSCLLGGGWALTDSKERTVTMDDGQQIKLMTMKLQKGNDKILGSYFFFMRGRVITSPWLNKLYLMWDSFTKQRTDGALVRAEMVVAPGQSVEEAWEELAGFIEGLWGILPAYVPI